MNAGLVGLLLAAMSYITTTSRSIFRRTELPKMPPKTTSALSGTRFHLRGLPRTSSHCSEKHASHSSRTDAPWLQFPSLVSGVFPSALRSRGIRWHFHGPEFNIELLQLTWLGQKHDASEQESLWRKITHPALPTCSRSRSVYGAHQKPHEHELTI